MLRDWKEKMLALGIAVVFVLFIGFAMDTFLEVDDEELYAMSLFIIACVAGIASITLGITINVESVGAGLIGGGVLSILYGAIRYMPYAENVIRVIFFGLALGALIWLGLKKFNRNGDIMRKKT